MFMKLPDGKKMQDLPPDQRAERRRLQKRFDQCAYLSIIQTNEPNVFIVTGGNEEHTLIIAGGTAICDCKGWDFAIDHLCSHVMKWRLVYGDLKR